MGFRFVCEHCENNSFLVFWDITRGGTTLESAINLKCAKCGTEYVLTPTIQWDFDNISHPNVEWLDDLGRPIDTENKEAEEKKEEVSKEDGR